MEMSICVCVRVVSLVVLRMRIVVLVTLESHGGCLLLQSSFIMLLLLRHVRRRLGGVVCWGDGGIVVLVTRLIVEHGRLSVTCVWSGPVCSSARQDVLLWLLVTCVLVLLLLDLTRRAMLFLLLVILILLTVVRVSSASSLINRLRPCIVRSQVCLVRDIFKPGRRTAFPARSFLLI